MYPRPLQGRLPSTATGSTCTFYNDGPTTAVPTPSLVLCRNSSGRSLCRVLRLFSFEIDEDQSEHAMSLLR